MPGKCPLEPSPQLKLLVEIQKHRNQLQELHGAPSALFTIQESNLNLPAVLL